MNPRQDIGGSVSFSVVFMIVDVSIALKFIPPPRVGAVIEA